MDFRLPPKDLAGYSPLAHKGDCEWDASAAARAVDFFADVLTHPDDSPTTKAGDPFVLCDWQKVFIATLFGWRRPNGKRRYTESLLAVPRKNGKSALAAGISLYCLFAEGKVGAQIYSAAMDRDQASAIYRQAARMVAQQPTLAKYLRCIDSTKRIVNQRVGSFYCAMSGDASTGHSKKPYVVLFDELHTQRNRDLYDNLRTGQGATNNPLFISITTAGFDRKSVCFEVWNRARRVRDNEWPDSTFLPCIYELPDDAPWDDEAIWHKCNPNLGVSISLDFLREECRKAKDIPAYENTFRNLYLNQWVEQATRWLSMDKWRACGTEELPDLTGEACFCALDLSSTTDICALAMLFPRSEGGYWLQMRFWVPGESARKRERMDGVPYAEWQRQDWLKMTGGDVADYDVIRAEINELNERYNIREIAIDRWNATQLTTQLTGDGFTVVPFGQGYASMSPAAKELEKQVIQGTLQHGGNPVLEWMAANVAIEKDAAGNIKPSKAKSTERIDGIVATAMALARASLAEPENAWSASDGILL